MVSARWAATAMAAAAVLACGRGASVQQHSTGRPDTVGSAGGGGAQGTPCDGSVTVAVRGVDAGTFGAFDVDLATLSAAVSGGPAAIDWSASTLRLGGGATPELLAMPRSHEPVDVTMVVGKVHVCGAQGCSDLDPCTLPMTFRFDVDRVVPNGCHVFLDLDLAASVQPTSSGPAFLPRFTVKYW